MWGKISQVSPYISRSNDNIDSATKPQCVEKLLTHGITNKAAYLCKWSNKVTFVVSFLIACFFLQSITCKYLARTSFHMIMKFAFKPLLIPAIQGCDFLRQHRSVLNYESGTYYRVESPNQALPLCVKEQRSCSVITTDEDCPQAVSVKCYGKDQIQLEMPTNVHPELKSVVQEFVELFSLGQNDKW